MRPGRWQATRSARHKQAMKSTTAALTFPCSSKAVATRARCKQSIPRAISAFGVPCERRNTAKQLGSRFVSWNFDSACAAAWRPCSAARPAVTTAWEQNVEKKKSKRPRRRPAKDIMFCLEGPEDGALLSPASYWGGSFPLLCRGNNNWELDRLAWTTIRSRPLDRATSATLLVRDEKRWKRRVRRGEREALGEEEGSRTRTALGGGRKGEELSLRSLSKALRQPRLAHRRPRPWGRGHRRPAPRPGARAPLSEKQRETARFPLLERQRPFLPL